MSREIYLSEREAGILAFAALQEVVRQEDPRYWVADEGEREMTRLRWYELASDLSGFSVTLVVPDEVPAATCGHRLFEPSDFPPPFDRIYKGNRCGLPQLHEGEHGFNG